MLATPVEKRDYSINEIVDTEKNYIEALAMIKTKFIRPLSNVLKEEDKKCIFYGIEVFLITDYFKSYFISTLSRFPTTEIARNSYGLPQ